MGEVANIRPDRGALRERMLEAVEGIGAVLEAQAAGEDAAGRLSRESSDALYDAGLLQMKLPAVLGGAEADLVTQFEVIEAVSMRNPAAGWCLMVGATSLAMPGVFLPEAGIDEMFADGRIPRGAILIMPSGRARHDGDGFVLEGRWAFASGVHHAEWIAAHALVETAEGPLLHMFVFPAGEATLHDNWQVAGLRGTGSCDISVEDLRVPEHRCWVVPGASAQRGGSLYRIGIPGFVAYEHAAFATGTARRALDALTALAIGKKRGYGPDAETIADRAPIQRCIGRGELALAAARALAMEANAEAMRRAESGEEIDTQLSLELRGAAVYCTDVATDIVTEAFRHAGAGAIYEGSVLQACLRDINVAAQHQMVNQRAYELLGQVHLGFDDINVMK